MAIARATVIAKMRGAFKAGVSASRFLADMKAAGLSYRRTDMLADWRNVNKLARVEGALQFVRRGYYPTASVIADVSWKISREYMYVVKVQTRLRPDEPVTERKVNIMTDIPMTPSMIEAEVESRWGEWEKYEAQELVGVQAWTAVHKVME